MDNKISIHPQGDTLTIREGKAAQIPEPQKISFSGGIDSPGIWAETQEFDKTKAHAVVDDYAGTITLYEDARTEKGATITGTVKPSKITEEFSINKERYWSTKELAKFLRMRRIWFTDPEENHRVVTDLNRFSAKVSTAIEQAQDTRGNKKNLVEKTVESNAPAGFRLTCPIFDGRNPATFLVEIGIEATDNGVRMWLESTELVEILEKEKRLSIAETLKAIEAEGITIMYK